MTRCFALRSIPLECTRRTRLSDSTIDHVSEPLNRFKVKAAGLIVSDAPLPLANKVIELILGTHLIVHHNPLKKLFTGLEHWWWGLIVASAIEIRQINVRDGAKILVAIDSMVMNRAIVVGVVFFVARSGELGSLKIIDFYSV